MKIEVGKYYRTRGGNKVIIIAYFDEVSPFLFVGRLCSGKDKRWLQSIYDWKPDGKYNGALDELDLIEEWDDEENLTIKEITYFDGPVLTVDLKPVIDKFNVLIMAVNILLRQYNEKV